MIHKIGSQFFQNNLHSPCNEYGENALKKNVSSL